MGTFKSTKTFYAPHSMISVIADKIAENFNGEGYQVQSQDLISGGYDISITKGGFFKAVLGMKTALKVNIQPVSDGIRIDAGVGIFGQQAVPTAISVLFFWPVLLTQIWGLVAQAKMDDRVMLIAAETIANEANKTTAGIRAEANKFCTGCGKRAEADAAFCSGCGRRM